MKNMKIDPKNIEFAGSAKPTQWGLIIGAAIDKYSGNTMTADDDLIRTAISDELQNTTLDIPTIDSLQPTQKEAIDKLLKDVTVNLSTEDLKTLF